MQHCVQAHPHEHSAEKVLFRKVVRELQRGVSHRFFLCSPSPRRQGDPRETNPQPFTVAVHRFVYLLLPTSTKHGVDTHDSERLARAGCGGDSWLPKPAESVVLHAMQVYFVRQVRHSRNQERGFLASARYLKIGFSSRLVVSGSHFVRIHMKKHPVTLAWSWNSFGGRQCHPSRAMGVATCCASNFRAPTL